MSTSKFCRPPCRRPSSPPPRRRSHSLPLLTRPLRIVRPRKVRQSRIASTMSGLGASADCPAPITAGNGDSICEPLINGSPVSVIYSVARCGTTNYSLNDTVLALEGNLRRFRVRLKTKKLFDFNYLTINPVPGAKSRAGMRLSEVASALCGPDLFLACRFPRRSPFPACRVATLRP